MLTQKLILRFASVLAAGILLGALLNIFVLGCSRNLPQEGVITSKASAEGVAALVSSRFYYTYYGNFTSFSIPTVEFHEEDGQWYSWLGYQDVETPITLSEWKISKEDGRVSSLFITKEMMSMAPYGEVTSYGLLNYKFSDATLKDWKKIKAKISAPIRAPTASEVRALLTEPWPRSLPLPISLPS